MSMPAPPAGARVLFLMRVAPERTGDFLAAYEKIRYAVAEGVDGHVKDQVCQSDGDPQQWLITSEWTSLDAFRAWERSPGHRTLVAPLRACFTDATSIRFVIHAETSRRSGGGPRHDRAGDLLAGTPHI